MSSPSPAPPPDPTATSVAATEPEAAAPAFRFRAWNLLLLVPLISLITPLFNMTEPRLAGIPFFYWFQMAVIPLGILCTLAVHLITRRADEEGTR
ncbi:DUF3311 domain-containing protein [Actinomycetospora sp. TBRC 11914]|uniref:DUF3311 domain-containing protein n=1 Tax=Actinomycetospora sp. TBRC 11914 TaxID=2729387 RepID=UPI00145DB8BE|nr:DUF3311 domain-containing protein [Actinomycetospora sp. TBRC 11914]NMO92021.1 DUF3311 domain-containing protein [Actinomycetospora sp. TBRC 11914]